MFAMRATYHTALQATPMQVVFSRDAILPLQFEANWQLIKEHKQKLIRANNEQENRSRINYTYRVGEQVLLKRHDLAKYQRDPWEGPYAVTEVNDNGTVRIQKDVYDELVNIRQLKPYRA